MNKRILFGVVTVIFLAFPACTPPTDVIPVERIRLESEALLLQAGQTGTLNAVVLPENASDKKLFWKSTDVLVLSINQSGVFEALTPGSAKIIVVGGGGVVFAECAVTVGIGNTGVTGVSINSESAVLLIGEQIRLVATVLPSEAFNKGVSWRSSNTSVATVNSDGLVTARADGEAIVTVTTDDGNFSAACSVTVMPDPVNLYTIDVFIEGSGNVDIDPVSDQYEENTAVTLTAVPDPEFVFLEWTGSISSSENPLRLTVTGDISVTALFEAVQPPPPPPPPPDEESDETVRGIFLLKIAIPDIAIRVDVMKKIDL